MNRTICPRPDKYAFESRSAAVGAFRRLSKRRKRNAHVYQCRCGAWHVGRTLRRALVAWRAEP